MKICDIHTHSSNSFDADFSKLIPKSNYETSIMKDRYKGKIKILRGIELGEPMHNDECTKKALCFGDFDIIIASVHNLRNRPDFYYMDFKKEDAHIILDMYFDELLETKYITLGSDAHNINDVGRDIEKGIELAFKAGFKSYYIYENCCPYEITIE